MLSTMPRRIASSATSCCDHWVIGRSLADGGSQAMAMMAQICSAPNLAARRSSAHPTGAPDRDPRRARQPTLVPSAHRLRPHPETARDLAHADAVIAMQDHARAQRHLLRRGAHDLPGRAAPRRQARSGRRTSEPSDHSMVAKDIRWIRLLDPENHNISWANHISHTNPGKRDKSTHPSRPVESPLPLLH